MCHSADYHVLCHVGPFNIKGDTFLISVSPVFANVLILYKPALTSQKMVLFFVCNRRLQDKGTYST